MATRHDAFGTVHKGLRAVLFEATALVARTDFGREDQARLAAEAVLRAVDFLDEHARQEDLVVMPELAKIAPALFLDLQGEHARTEGLHREIAQICARMGGAGEAARVSLGRRLHGRVTRLVAEHLLHMEREEQEAARALSAHRTDDELRVLGDRVLAAISPRRAAEWAEIVLPAASAPERAEVVARLRATMSPEAFEEVTGPARGRLGTSGWAAISDAPGG